MRAVVFCILVVIGIGCGSSDTRVLQTNHFVPASEGEEDTVSAEDVQLIARELEKAIDFISVKYVTARFAAIHECRYDYEELHCVVVLGSLDRTGSAIVKANEAIKKYRRTGEKFEETLRAVNEATNEMEGLVRDLHGIGKKL